MGQDFHLGSDGRLCSLVFFCLFLIYAGISFFTLEGLEFAPLGGLLFALPAYALWRLGLRSYISTGSQDPRGKI